MNDEQPFPPSVDALIRHVDDEAAAPTREDADRSWRQLAQRLDASERAPLAEGHRGRRHGGAWRRWIAGVATAAAVVCGVLAYRAVPTRGALGTAARATEYVTARGERATITLSDGSRVTLNVASRLSVPVDYASGNRVLRLDGEALFDVGAQSGAPFTVVAGPSVTRVLGTQFLVRHYDTDTLAMVAVRAGKVSVRSVVVTANQQARVDRNGRTRVAPADLSQFSFASGTLTMDGRTLADAIPELGRWYDADIRLGDAAVGKLVMRSEFASGSLTDLTSILELTFDVRVVRDGRVLTLYSR
jgi:ferric-dicitrate binding protein FerR (iron transport regulator)